jgi:CheY-like chemotaxis protein
VITPDFNSVVCFALQSLAMILKGWKDVATHLGCGLRTAQRWEQFGLPVRRPNAHKRSAVLALSEELDAWVSEQAGSTRPSSSETAHTSFSHRILIIDPDERLLVDLSAKLVREGYEVRTARDGFEALAVMQVGVPNLVISEVKMPMMSGFELMGVIRRRFPATAVIASSADFSPASSPTLLCDRYIAKGPNARFERLEAARELLAQSPLRAQPAKVDTAPAWILRSTKGYVVLSCLSCLRSFSLAIQTAILGTDATTPCVHCGVQVRYHIDDSVLPMAGELSHLIQTARARIDSSKARVRAFRETGRIRNPKRGTVSRRHR